MRVLLLDQYSDRGGGQRMLLESLCAIRERGWNAWVGLPGDGPMFHEVERLGFRTARISCGTYSSGAKSARDSVRFLAEMPRLAGDIANLAEQFAPDVIYVNGPRLLPALALARLGRPVLFHAHTAMPSRAQRWLTGVSVRELNASVVAVSETIAESWRRFGPVSVIYNAVAAPHEVVEDRPAAAPRIGCIGRISPEKGQRQFLRVAARILDDIPDARFFVYGKALFGDLAAERYEREVRAEAKDLPVAFAGWIDDVYEALANLDVLLVPSIWQEPNALVILEAFAAGVPVIAFRAGGIPEFLDQLCDTPEQMAHMAVDLLRDRDRYHALAAEGRENWRHRYTPARYRREISEALYLHSRTSK
jgi:glycosyltransferase involved in cell wall biosynthesis